MHTEPNIVLRPVKAFPMHGVTPAVDVSALPSFEWVDPASLFIEERYQRSLAEKSVTLIRKIVADWDWARMKPPICARDETGRLFVVDGQHTAIAAASHPAIDTIPIMIINAITMEGRASAFIGHNRDRVAMTSMQLHYASLAAGDEIAIAMDEACAKSGCAIRKSPPPNGICKVGETLAVKAVEALVKRKGVNGGARVLGILKGAAGLQSVHSS